MEIAQKIQIWKQHTSQNAHPEGKLTYVKVDENLAEIQPEPQTRDPTNTTHQNAVPTNADRTLRRWKPVCKSMLS